MVLSIKVHATVRHDKTILGILLTLPPFCYILERKSQLDHSKGLCPLPSCYKLYLNTNCNYILFLLLQCVPLSFCLATTWTLNPVHDWTKYTTCQIYTYTFHEYTRARTRPTHKYTTCKIVHVPERVIRIREPSSVNISRGSLCIKETSTEHRNLPQFFSSREPLSALCAVWIRIIC